MKATFFILGLGLSASLSSVNAASSIPEGLQATFDQAADLKWRKATSDTMPESAISRAQVYCRKTSDAEILVVWNSESGDWAVFDRYRTGKPFFEREVRFAQYEDKISIKKMSPKSAVVIRFGSRELKQYEFLKSEIEIWSRVRDVPFPLPACAKSIFM